MYTRILDTRLSSYVETDNVISNEQVGYREGFSLTEHIFTLHSLIQRQFSNDRKLYVAFVDYKKMFDSINREGLFKILKKIGVQGKLFNALQSIYHNVDACVRDGNDLSDVFNCPTGLKQGCLCSPKLCIIVLNEISKALNKRSEHGIQL